MVSDPKDQQEPSMEEILSSIRRIIADEESEERDEAPLDLDKALSEAQEGEEEDDVLELTEVVRETGDVVDLQAEAEPDEEPPEVEAAVEERIESEAEEAADEVEVELLPTEEEDALPEEAPPAAVETPAAPPAAAVTPVVPPAVGEGLVSAATAGATAGAFAKLNLAMQSDSEGEAAVPESDRTIEAFLAELLRPMLREWLEENLPPMVERLVAEEIEKLAKRAELL